MPRIKYSTASGGLYVNNVDTLAPEGTLFRARNVASLAGTGYVRSTPPVRLLAGSPTLARARTKFNGRFVNRGTSSGEKIERETAIGSGTYTTLTLPADSHPTLTLPNAASPTQFLLGQPTPERDEFLFALDPANTVSGGATSAALLKIRDDNTVTHWGILPPTATEVKDTTGIIAAKVAQEARYIFPSGSQDAFDDTTAGVADGTAPPAGAPVDWVLSSGDEDALTAVSFLQSISTPIAPGSTKSLKVRAEQDAVVVATRIFASPVDLTHFPISGNVSSDMDYIQFYVRVKRATHIESVEIQFDTESGSTGTFKRNTFKREINFTLVKGRTKRKLVGTGDIIPKRNLQDYLKNFPPGTNDQTAGDQTGQQAIPVARGAWSKVSLPKNSFNGFTEGADWSRVKAVRVIVHTNTDGKAAVFFDELQLVGGPGLIGDYQYTIVYSSDEGTPASAGSRSNPCIDDDDGSATGKRNAIVGPRVFDVDRQTVQLTFSNGLNFDPQTKRIEIWRTVGNGEAYFLAGYITVFSTGTLAPGYQFVDQCADYYGLNSTATKTVVGANTSFAVLDPTVELPLDNTSPNDPSFAFQDVADRIAYGRCWWARNVSAIPSNSLTPTNSLGNLGLVYYSPPGRLEAVQGYVYVTSGITDPVTKVIVWNDRPFALTQSGLYEIIGTDEPFVAQKIEGAPGTRYQFSVQSTAAGLFYLSDDGVYKFNGQYAENITDPVLLPVFKLRQTVGDLTPGFSTTVRSMAGKHAYYLGPDAGSNTFTFAYDFESGTWRYLQGATNSNTNTGAMFYDPSTGQAFVNITGADIRELEPQTYPSSGSNTFTVEPLPYVRSGPGKQGILRKLWIDVTLGTTGAVTAVTPTTTIDGVTTALTSFTPGATGLHFIQEYNLNFPGEVFGIRLDATGARDLRVNAIEMDVYVPGETDEA